MAPETLLTCREALDQLDGYLDDTLVSAAGARVRFHLDLCRDCARKFHFEVRWVAVMRHRLRRFDPPTMGPTRFRPGPAATF